MHKFRGDRGRAFDAAGASGMAFLNSQLELLNVDLVKPLQAVTYARDIVVETGGGFAEFVSAWASNYGTTGGNQYGLQGTQQTDIAMVQADIQKGTWRTFNWAAAMVISYIDLKRMELANRTGMAPPFSLQQLLEDAVQMVWNKALDRVTYLGWLGLPGLVNATGIVTETLVPDGASGSTTWASKTGPEILNDVNFLVNQTVENSGYDIIEGMADSMLVPWTQWAYITQPMTIAGCQSIYEYIKKYCVATANGIEFNIFPLPNPWIAGQGSGSTDRAVVYKNEKKAVYLKIPVAVQKAMTVPTTRSGGAYETIYNGCIGQPMWLRPTTAIYGDGI